MLFGIVPNLEKKNADKAAFRAAEQLKVSGADCVLPLGAEHIVAAGCGYMDVEEIYRKCDIIVAAGGDGTLIHAAKRAARYGKPVVGINTGRVGYIASLEPDEIPLLSKCVAGDYTVEERMMLAASVGSKTVETDCLNDISVVRDNGSRILDICVKDRGRELMTPRADGLIIATPNGSTAYAMSAGGPVTDPTIECMLAVPVCPMSLYTRGFVLSPKSELEISLLPGDSVGACVKFDGDGEVRLAAGESVHIRRSERAARLIKLKDSTFYSVFKNKMSLL